ncbi:MAG: WGR domain-containing protein, partial [Myxococcota bacterium]
MKLIQQTILLFQRGRSEKVYEVDLCEVGDGQYVVNFRYGRRGASLKDGSKTPLPVSLAQAEAAFEKLVSAKTKAGYVDVTGRDLGVSSPAPGPAVAGPTMAPATPSASVLSAASGRRLGGRAQAVLDRLMLGDVVQTRGRRRRRGRGAPVRSGSSTWSLNRAIWKAGEMRLREAAPLMMGMLGSQGALRDYSVVWALGRCGDPVAIGALNRVFVDGRHPSHVRRMAAEALMSLYDDSGKARFREALVDALPVVVREALEAGDADALCAVVRTLLETPGSGERFEVLG